jgi:hypothetical protein
MFGRFNRANAIGLVTALFVAACDSGSGSTPPPPPPPPPPPTTATVNFEVVNERDDDHAFSDQAYLLIDGERQSLPPSGRASLELEAGDYDVLAVEPDLVGGSVSISVEAEQTVDVEISVNEVFAGVFPARLTANGEPFALVSESQVEFSLTAPDGADRLLTDLDYVDATPVGRGATSPGAGTVLGEPVDITDFFSLTDGRLSVSDAPGLINALTALPAGDVEVTLAGYDADTGVPYYETVLLSVGRFDLDVAINVPDGLTANQFEGGEVIATVEGTPLERIGVIDAGGTVSFEDLPVGNIDLFGEIEIEGQFYTLARSVFMDADRDLAVDLIFFEDDEGSSAQGGLMEGQSQDALRPDRRAAQDDYEEELRRRALSAQSDDVDLPSDAFSVSGGSADTPIRETRVFSFPESAQSAVLVFEVRTAEYPVFVNQQSIFNDTWAVRAFSANNGKLLYQAGEAVNSQLNGTDFPWNAQGSTGVVSRLIDLSGVPVSDGQRQVRLQLESQNVADSALPTVVTAGFDSADFTIRAGALQPVPRGRYGSRENNPKVASIPEEGARNGLAREIEITMEPVNADEPVTAADVTRVLVEASLGGQFSPVWETDSVQAVEGDDQTFLVSLSPVQGGGYASPFDTTPPPGNNLNYRVTVEAGASEAQTQVNGVSPLYRVGPELRSGSRRYSLRDDGFDDWSHPNTIAFLEANASVWTRFNDISGEHGRDLGHKSHQQGLDVDLYQFAEPLAPCGDTNGSCFSGKNYSAVESLALDALSGDEAARYAVEAWFEAQRAGLDSLLRDPRVVSAHAAQGRARGGQGGLRRGWFEDLLRNGQTVSPDQTLTLTIAGSFTPPKRLRHDSVHNSHYHIDIRR